MLFHNGFLGMIGSIKRRRLALLALALVLATTTHGATASADPQPTPTLPVLPKFRPAAQPPAPLPRDPRYRIFFNKQSGVSNTNLLVKNLPPNAVSPNAFFSGFISETWPGQSALFNGFGVSCTGTCQPETWTWSVTAPSPFLAGASWSFTPPTTQNNGLTALTVQTNNPLTPLGIFSVYVEAIGQPGNIHPSNGPTYSILDMTPPGKIKIEKADIKTDTIQIVLSPAIYSGLFVVNENYTDSTGSHTWQLANGTATGGTHTLHFKLKDIPVGQYSRLDVSWAPNGVPLTQPQTTRFYVLGLYEQTQYAFPYESTCSGSPTSVNLWNQSTCAKTLGSYLSVFNTQVVLNGTGVPSEGGYCHGDAHSCGQPSYDGINFLEPYDGSGACPGIKPTGSTVAISQSSALLTLNCTNPDQVLIVGLGSGAGTVKKVLDYCGSACDSWPPPTVGHIDNFITGSFPNCDIGTVPTLPNFKTIRVNR
jgi:hypothetical protein